MMCAGRGDFKVISVFLNGTVCSFFARTDLSDWRRGFLRLGVCSCASRISRVSSILYSFYIYIFFYIYSFYILLSIVMVRTGFYAIVRFEKTET